MVFVADVQHQHDQQRHHDTDEVERIGHEHLVFAKEDAGEEHIDGQPGTTGHERGDQHGLIPVSGVFQHAGGHDGWDTAPESQHHGQERPSGQPQFPHDTVHHVGHTSHVTAVLQQCQGQEEDKDIGQKSQDSAHTGDDAIHHQGDDHVGHVQELQQVGGSIGQCRQKELEPIAEAVA